MKEKLLSRSPRKVWEHFLALSGIPRPPGGEGKVREHLGDLAASKGWESAGDEAGNLVLRVPGRGALAGAEPLILQSHMDMVCEKDPGVEHDFIRDPLRLEISGGWLKAAGTTLGADNGIGMALALAAAEADLPQSPPLELLFTVEEETGLTGAIRLDAAMLRGRRLINLDSETEGVFIVGCAGGRFVTARFAREAGAGAPPGHVVRCRIGGLRGGHSGIDINDNRANALACAAGIIEELRRRAGGVRLISLEGGTQFNVIPREAEFVVSGTGPDEVEDAASWFTKDLRASEPGISVAVNREEQAGTGALPWAVVDFINVLPKGVIAMDDAIEDLVHTSSNLGVARSDESGASLSIMVRSAEDAGRDGECERAVALARECGGEGELGDAFPGWASSSGSELVRGLGETYRDLFGRPVRVTGIHAGLEAGVIGAMIGSGELVSLGPTIENPHSPGERLLMDSVEPVSRLLEAFLASPRRQGDRQPGTLNRQPEDEAHGPQME